MRVDRCDFSGFRVYPAKGRTYVRGDSKVCFCALLAVNQSIMECKPHEELEGDGHVIKGIGRISGCDRGRRRGNCCSFGGQPRCEMAENESRRNVRRPVAPGATGETLQHPVGAGRLGHGTIRHADVRPDAVYDAIHRRAQRPSNSCWNCRRCGEAYWRWKAGHSARVQGGRTAGSEARIYSGLHALKVES